MRLSQPKKQHPCVSNIVASSSATRLNQDFGLCQPPHASRFQDSDRENMTGWEVHGNAAKEILCPPSPSWTHGQHGRIELQSIQRRTRCPDGRTAPPTIRNKTVTATDHTAAVGTDDGSVVGINDASTVRANHNATVHAEDNAAFRTDEASSVQTTEASSSFWRSVTLTALYLQCSSE